jgi:hypothetical protein
MDVLWLYLELGRSVVIAVGWVFVAWMAVAIPTALVLGRVIAQADGDAPVVCEDDDEVTR